MQWPTLAAKAAGWAQHNKEAGVVQQRSHPSKHEDTAADNMYIYIYISTSKKMSSSDYQEKTNLANNEKHTKVHVTNSTERLFLH